MKTTITVPIRSRWDSTVVLFAAEVDPDIAEELRVREAVVQARNARANLGGANLGGANLGGANLGGANLGGADLGGANLRSADLRSADLGGADLGGANLGGANLGGANLGGADLGGANLGGANLGGANLGGANLGGANLGGANLGGANLGGANLRSADLRSANLGGADLGGANLGGANLGGANLGGADLGGANLASFKRDVEHVLYGAPMEVSGLLTALRDGKVDGSTYTGPCACLVGTIANVRGCNVDTLAQDSSRPAEVLFTAIHAGDTPETNNVSKIVEGWIVEWLEANERAIALHKAFAGVPTEEILNIGKE